ncbi:MAG: thiamine pyrophosphate-binding protein, partial [Candidatus Planktophila sp.]
MSKKMSGAKSLVQSLESAGVDVMFGIPGGAILPAYDPIFDSSIRHILVRHEQGAGFMADGHARISGKPGVCVLVSGPGVLNAATPIAQAWHDSIPMLVLARISPSHPDKR